MGILNDNYNQSQSQILMIPSIPIVNQSYSPIIHEESQRAHLEARESYEEGESSSLVAATVMRHGHNLKQKLVMSPHYEGGETSGSNAFSRNDNNVKPRKNNLQYDFCHCRGHTKEQCYKLIGYPSDFKFTRNKERKEGAYRNGNLGYRNTRSNGYSANSLNVNYPKRHVTGE